jgi:hypothetical protein
MPVGGAPGCLTEGALYAGVGAVVVDGFKVLGLDTIPGERIVTLSGYGNIADEVFDKDGIFVGFVGDIFFIRSFEQAVELAAGTVLNQIDEIFNPDGRT